MSEYYSKILFFGQRKAKKEHECDFCFRPIKNNEYYYCKIYNTTALIYYF